MMNRFIKNVSLSEVHGSVDTTGKGSWWKQAFVFFGPAYLVSVVWLMWRELPHPATPRAIAMASAPPAMGAVVLLKCSFMSSKWTHGPRTWWRGPCHHCLVTFLPAAPTE